MQRTKDEDDDDDDDDDKGHDGEAAPGIGGGRRPSLSSLIECVIEFFLVFSLVGVVWVCVVTRQNMTNWRT